MTGSNGSPALVILAAGLGSRYGDAKQVAGVGPDGEWLLEYAIHDAFAAGFGDVVMVIRAELRESLQARLGPRVGNARLHFVEQSSERVPVGCEPPRGRRKPLGTGHALWCCAGLLHGPFAVINADDYYGRHAFGLLAEHFSHGQGPAMVGYRLDAALSEHGGVNRGVCRVDSEDGLLEAVTEYTDIALRKGRLTGTAPGGESEVLPADRVVSLNCWGLLPELLPDLEAGLRTFLAHPGDSREYYLPEAISRHLSRHGRKLAVLPTGDAWLGLTYPDDYPKVVAALAALHTDGTYPTPLWPPA